MEVPVDSFGRPQQQCAFWSCNEWFTPRGNRRFCSRGCKQADSKKRSRDADRTRARRRQAGRNEGVEEGHLYVIQAGSEPIVKVGYSRNLEERFRNFQTAHYLDLRIVSSIETVRAKRNDPPDKLLHLALPEEDHIRGEWWWLTPATQEVLRDAGFDLSSLTQEPSWLTGGGFLDM